MLSLKNEFKFSPVQTVWKAKIKAFMVNDLTLQIAHIVY